MKKRFLAGIALLIMLTGEGLVPLARATFVRTAPPRARNTVVVGRAPRRGMVWRAGYWGPARRGRRQFVWMPGRWVMPPRTGAVWVSPRWRRSRGGYTFVAGRWR